MEDIRAGHPIITGALIVTAMVAIAVIAAGVVLVFLGQTSALSEIKLFGQQVNTTSVGVVGIFCGAVVGVLGVRSALKTVIDLGRLGR